MEIHVICVKSCVSGTTRVFKTNRPSVRKYPNEYIATMAGNTINDKVSICVLLRLSDGDIAYFFLERCAAQRSVDAWYEGTHDRRTGEEPRPPQSRFSSWRSTAADISQGGQPDSDKQKQYQQSSGTAHGIGASGAPIGQQSHYGEGGKAMLGGDCKCERQGGTCTCRQGSTQEGGCQCGMSGGVCTCGMSSCLAILRSWHCNAAAKPGEANLGGSFWIWMERQTYSVITCILQITRFKQSTLNPPRRWRHLAVLRSFCIFFSYPALLDASRRGQAIGSVLNAKGETDVVWGWGTLSASQSSSNTHHDTKDMLCPVLCRQYKRTIGCCDRLHARKLSPWLSRRHDCPKSTYLSRQLEITSRANVNHVRPSVLLLLLA